MPHLSAGLAQLGVLAELAAGGRLHKASSHAVDAHVAGRIRGSSAAVHGCKCSAGEATAASINITGALFAGMVVLMVKPSTAAMQSALPAEIELAAKLRHQQMQLLET
jgi:hypothetical protein